VSLAALGCYLQHIKLFEPIRERVTIAQKTIGHTPIDKHYDAWIALLAGAHGLVEINTRLRADLALQRAFGRAACADQSTIQDTLNACSTENVAQMQQALTTIYRHHSRGYRHDYARWLQVLDIDLSGLPCDGVLRTLLATIIAYSDLGRIWYQCREWGQGFPQEGVPAPYPC
jgi:hypothetical protein